MNPRLIYCSCKGFLPGPYEHRAALDEVVQMMGGLAYMTGPPGQPLRAGSSVNDIMGGMFGVIAILAALARARGDRARRPGPVRPVRDQHGAGRRSTWRRRRSRAAIRRPSATREKVRPWPVYDVFDTADDGAAGVRRLRHRHAMARLLRGVRPDRPSATTPSWPRWRSWPPPGTAHPAAACRRCSARSRKPS